MPYPNLTAALVLDDVDLPRVTDFGTSYTRPEDYLDRLVPLRPLHDGRSPEARFRPVPLEESDAIVSAVRKAQSGALPQHRGDGSATRRSGAAPTCTSRSCDPSQLAVGIADDLDWTVPRDIPGPLYDLISQIEGDNTTDMGEGPYYDLHPVISPP